MELFKLGFITVRLVDLLDISVVSLLIYKLYNLLRGSLALRILGALGLLVIAWKLVEFFDLVMLKSVLDVVMGVGGLALFVLFAPEIRRFLVNLARNSFLDRVFRGGTETEVSSIMINEMLEAAEEMRKAKIGALIVIPLDDNIDAIVETGEPLDAAISSRLIVSVFHSQSPLHDGAIVVQHGKILAARCILPISEKADLPAELGLRHRSGLGITETTHAMALMVSEERGEISIAYEGRLYRNLDLINVERMLRSHFKLS